MKIKKKAMKVDHANSNHKRAGVAVMISDKIDFKNKNVNRGKKNIL